MTILKDRAWKYIKNAKCEKDIQYLLGEKFERAMKYKNRIVRSLNVGVNKAPDRLIKGIQSPNASFHGH